MRNKSNDIDLSVDPFADNTDFDLSIDPFADDSAQKGLNFVDRYQRPSQYPTLENSDGSYSTHRMASAEVDGKYIAYPTIVQMPTGELKQLSDDEAFQYAMQNNEYLSFPDDNAARSFAENGYKKDWGKGENLPSMEPVDYGLLDKAADWVKSLTGADRARASNELAMREYAQDRGLNVDQAYQAAGGSRPTLDPLGRGGLESVQQGFEKAGAYSVAESKRQQQVNPDEAGTLSRAGEGMVHGFENMVGSLEIGKHVLAGGNPSDMAQLISDKIEKNMAQSQNRSADEAGIYGALDAVTESQGLWEGIGSGVRAAGEFFGNPDDAAVISAEQAPNMIPAIGLGAAGAGAGFAVGGVPGAIVGGRTGMAAGTVATEFGAEIEQAIVERLGNNVMAPNRKELIQEILLDPEFVAEAQARAAKKGVTVALVDQAFLGLSGKIANVPGNAASTLTKAKYGAAGAGVDMAGESIGEASSQLVARGEVDAGDALLEGFASGPSAIAETAIGKTIDGANKAYKGIKEKQSSGLQDIVADTNFDNIDLSIDPFDNTQALPPSDVIYAESPKSEAKGNANNGMEGQPTINGYDIPTLTDEIPTLTDRVDVKPETPMLPPPVYAGYLDNPNPQKNVVGKGLDGIPDKVGRMDSDPDQKAADARKSLDRVMFGERYIQDKVSDYKKEKIKEERLSNLPEGTKDERLLKPDYKDNLIAAAKRFEEAGKRVHAKGVDARKDDLFDAIAKLGGIDREELSQDGFDQEDMKGIRSGIRPVFTKKGRSVDDMAEALIQDGYLAERDPEELKQKIREQLAGTSQYSNAFEQDEFDGMLAVAREMGANPAQAGNALSKALSGKPLTEKQSRIVSGVLDAIQADKNSPENIEYARKIRREKNIARKAMRENAELKRYFDSTQAQIPDADYTAIAEAEFDASQNLSQDERIVAEALVDAMRAGLPEAVTDELSIRIDDSQSLATAIEKAIREHKANERRRQSNIDGEGKTNAAQKDNQSRSEKTISEDAGRNTGSRNQEMERTGPGQRKGRESLSGSSQGQTGQSGPVEDDFLSTYSEADILKREADNKAAEEKEIKAKQEAEQKEKADQDVSGFMLTGSDRQADSNPNQTDLLDAESINIAANEAATSSKNDLPEPTQAQKEAGNYKLGKVKVQGLDISIENPKDSVRSGTSPDGKKWSNKMGAHYGYIRKTEGADGDHVDVFLGEFPESEQVWIVDQVNQDGSFDEHKVLMGFKNKITARKAYVSSYDEGWQVGPITQMSMDEFKTWLEGNTKKPLKLAEATKTPSNEGVSVSLRDISEKAFVVEGDTKPHKDRLKALGGKWNFKSKAWMFPKSREDKIRNELSDILGDKKISREDKKAYAEPQKTKQFQNYKKFIDGLDGKPIPEGMVDQILIDERLDDGESDELLDISGYGKPVKEKTPEPKSKLDKVVDSIDAEIDEVAAELAELLKAQLRNSNMGVDPAILALGAKLGALYVSKGVVKFAQYSQAVLKKLSEMGVDPDQVKPMLKEFYAATQAKVSDDLFDQMDDMRTVRKFDLDTLNVSKPTTAKSESLDDFIFQNIGDIKSNINLKKVVAEYYGVKSGDVTDSQMKMAQEAVELALVKQAREKVSQDQGDEKTYYDLLEMYLDQPNLNMRSSTSMENQAYSTPAPLAFLSSQMAGIHSESAVYEPTAGNGMLLLGANQELAVANELENLRVSQLKKLGFNVTQKDATTNNPGKGNYDAVIMNPPFGKLRDDKGNLAPVNYDGYTIKSIDHLIVAKALEAMSDDGKAAIIIGADKVSGNISSSDRIFFNWLYSHYNVTDHFEVDGKLYGRQGANWPIRIISVNGRVESDTLAPKSGSIERFNNWDDIYEHYKQGLDSRGEFVGSGAKGTSRGSEQRAGNDASDIQKLFEGQTGETDKPSRKERNTATVNRDRSGLASRNADESGGRSGGSANLDRQPKLNNEQGKADQDANELRTSSGTAESDAKQSGKRPVSKPVSSSSFQSQYRAKSSGFNEAVLTPNNMAEPLEAAFTDIEKTVGDIDQYVIDKLGYASIDDLHSAFMGLQVDAVAATIYNFENKNKGVIIADQTGVGKGRQAAGVIRYAIREGKIPVFVTVKDNLFTDMYNDLADIGSKNVRPLILNADSSIKGKDGSDLFKNPGSTKNHKQLIRSLTKERSLPSDRNALFMTYSQINTQNEQREFVKAIAENAIFILDESHNAAGDQVTIGKKNGVSVKQSTGAGFINEVINNRPVLYLSATFAKRPDNMPVYYRTDLMDAVDSPAQLVDAVSAGGVPLQSAMSGMLARAGQLIRRERSFEGISIPIVFDKKNKAYHAKIADQITSGLRAVVNADTLFHTVFFEYYKKQADKVGFGIAGAGNKASKTMDHSNFNAVVHNYVRQLLLSLKADEAAEKAIAAYKKGIKPVIALENTMGSFLQSYAEDMGLKVGDVIEADYRDVMLKALDRTRRISIKDEKGSKRTVDIPLSTLDPVTRKAFQDAESLINSLDISEFPISPIDLMRNKLISAGIKTQEITGRDLIIDYSGKKPVLAKKPAAESKSREVVDRFNNGEIDAIILNVAGSTGLSIHASEKFKDQRPRHMVVAQPMQDINILVQMLGRINRTGQLKLPTYELMGLDLPAEKRPLAKTAKNMKSLNANTSANEESDSSINMPDMFNKYGDQVVAAFLSENPEIASAVSLSGESESSPSEGLALRFTGRAALLSVKMQEEIYAQIEPAYESKMEYLTKTGQNDLIASTMDTDAKILESKIVYEGKKPGTIFGGHTTLHKVNIKLQGKPPLSEDVEAAIKNELGRLTPKEYVQEIVDRKRSDEGKVFANLQGRLDTARKALAEYKAKGNIKAEKLNALEENIKQVESLEGKYRTYIAGMKSRLDRFSVRSAFRLDLGDDIVNGVVVGIKDMHRGLGDPWASSKIQVRFMVASGIRTIDIGLSDLAPDKGIVQESVRDSIKKIFTDNVDSNAREIRYIATGNLIAGSAKLRGGRIVNFTDDKGNTHQGIIMPKKYGKDGEYDAVGSESNFSIRDPKTATKLLKNNEDKIEFAVGIFSESQNVRISRDKKGWYVSVPKSNKGSDGQEVKFDDDLRKLTGDFYGSSQIMKAYFDDNKLEKVVSRVMEITPLYALPSMRDAWVKAGGKKQSEAVQSFENDSGVYNVQDAIFSKADSEVKNPISEEELQQVVDQFMSDYNGNIPIDPVILNHQEEAYGEAGSVEKIGRIEAAYHAKFRKLLLIRTSIRNKKHAQRILGHELLGHYGLNTFNPGNKRFFLERILASRNSPSLKSIWKQIDSLYPNDSEMQKAEEVFAFVVEQGDSIFKRFIDWIADALRKILKKDGLVKGLISKSELRDIARQIAKGIKSGERDQQNFPKSDFAQFSRSEQEEDALEKLGLKKKEAKRLADTIQKLKDANFKELIAGYGSKAYEGAFDGLIGIKRAEDTVEGITHANSGYVGARLASGIADTMTAILHYGAPQWRDGILQKKAGTRGLLDIFSDLDGDLSGWLGWMGGKRAQELMGQNKENNLNEDDIEALLGLSRGKEALFERVRQDYIKLNNAMLDMAQEAGLIDPESREKWQSDYYVPFYRQTEIDGDMTLLAPRTRRGLSHQTAGIKALKGGEMATNNLLENILTNWIKLTDSSMKNAALLKTVNNLKDTDYLQDETMRFKKAFVPKGQVNKIIREDRAFREAVADMLGMGRRPDINKLINKVANLDAAGYEQLWAITAPADPDVIRVQRNGKNEYYKVTDESLLRAVKHMSDLGAQDPLTRGARFFKRLLTTGVTSSPDFILRNFIRDGVHAWAINGDKFKFGKDSFKGLHNAIKEDDDYVALMFAGASFQGGYVHGTDPERSAQIVRRALEKKGLTGSEIESYENSLLNSASKAKGAIQSGWQHYREVGDKVENANRLSTFKASLKAGKPMAQAVFEAKDLMDYSLRGNLQTMVWFTDVIPFLNARLQGLNKLGRAAKENPKRVLVSAGLKIAAFSVALAMLNDDDERYQELPDWDKDANWHFWIGDQHWRLPKPFEIGILFGTLPERMYHTLAGNQENEKLWWSFKHNLFNTLNINPIPQLVMPVAEVVANRSFFFDTPIEGMADEGKLTEARYSERTSSTMKELGDLGKWVGLSPKELEHLWNGYLGTMGTYGLMVADIATNYVTDRSERPEFRLEDYPVIKSFYRGSGPAKSTQYMTDLYDRLTEVEQIYRTINEYDKTGLYEKADSLAEKNADKLDTRKWLLNDKRDISDINKEMDEISRDETMSGKEKRERIDELMALRNEIARDASKSTEYAY